LGLDGLDIIRKTKH